MVFAPTNCLVVTAFVLSLVSWVCGIIALAFPDWLVIEASGTKTRIGAFKICDDQLSGSPSTNSSSTSLFSSSLGHGECQSVSATGFSFGSCERGSSDVASRFGVVQGLGIVGIVLGVIATALLIASYCHGLYLRGAAANRARKYASGARRADGFSEITGTDRNAPHHQYHNDQYNGNNNNYATTPAVAEEDELMASTAPPSRVPIMEIIAFVAQLLSVAAAAVSSFFYLSTVETWLFCNSKPCAYIMSATDTSSGDSSGGTIVGTCRSGYGWAYALSYMMWVAGIFVLVALCLRWLLRDPLPEGAEGLSRDAYAMSMRNHNRAVVAPPPGRGHFSSGSNDDEDEDSGSIHRSRRVAPTSAAATTYYEGGETKNNGKAVDYYSNNNNYNNDNHKGAAPLPVNVVRVHDAPPAAPSAVAVAAPTSSSPATGHSPFRSRADGEPECDLPEGVWEWDPASQLFWSEEQQYFFDHNSGHFYEPETGQWYNPQADQWYSL